MLCPMPGCSCSLKQQVHATAMQCTPTPPQNLLTLLPREDVELLAWRRSIKDVGADTLLLAHMPIKGPCCCLASWNSRCCKCWRRSPAPAAEAPAAPEVEAAEIIAEEEDAQQERTCADMPASMDSPAAT